MLYSSWKFIHHMDKIEDIKKGNTISPVRMIIVLTNKCKCKCHFCFDMEKNKFYNETLDKEVVFKVLEDAKSLGVKSIEFTGGGEPTDHPFFSEIFGRAKELGFELGLITNGTNLNNIDLSLLDNISWLRISMNALSDKVYKETCGVEMNYRHLLGQIAKLNTTTGLSFIITPRNYHEAIDFVKFAKETGFDNVHLAPARSDFQIAPYMTDFINNSIEIVSKVKEFEDESFKVFAKDERYKVIDSIEKNFSQCHYQQFVATIWSNGDIIPCWQSRGRNDFVFGNIYEKTFKQIWAEKQLMPIEKCSSACIFEEKNKFLEYLVEKEPKHVNFV